MLPLPYRHLVIAASLLLIGCSGSYEPYHGPVARARAMRIIPTTDVPALLGASIDGLRQRLGPMQPLPATLRPSDVDILLSASKDRADSVVAFRTGGLTMIASFDVRSRQVRDLLLLGHHEDSLMGRARLHTGAADYLVLPVFYAGTSYRLMGLRVIATQ